MKPKILDTNLKAYFGEVVKKLGERQKIVLHCLFDNRLGMTNLEVARKLGWDTNQVVPRVFELRELELVKDSGKKTCSISGRTAHKWVVAE